MGKARFAFLFVTKLPIFLLTFYRAISNGSTQATKFWPGIFASLRGTKTSPDGLLVLLGFALGQHGFRCSSLFRVHVAEINTASGTVLLSVFAMHQDVTRIQDGFPIVVVAHSSLASICGCPLMVFPVVDIYNRVIW